MDRVNLNGWAHLVSDCAGERGKKELVEFGMKIGLERRPHRYSTYAEHFDIREEEADRAIKAGARVVSRRELADILRWKKECDANPCPGDRACCGQE